MKKNVRRIACSLMATVMAGSLALEFGIRQGKASAETKTTVTQFTDVTGQLDTTALRQENFNSSVLEADDTPTYEKKTVIVSFEGDSLMDAAGNMDVVDYLATKAGQSLSQKITAQQDKFLAKLTAKKIGYTVTNRYSAVDNAVAIQVNTRYVDDIKEMSGVRYAVVSNTYAAPQTTDSTSGGAVSNNANVYATGVYNTSAALEQYSGEGTVVAILDTGLDYTHSAFQKFYSGDDAVKAWSKDMRVCARVPS